MFIYAKLNMNKKWFPILCYHRVCPPDEKGVDSPSLCVSPKQFKRQIALLKFLGYRAITVQELTAYLEERKNPPGKTALITFDDGYQDNYLHAFPILKEFAFSAAVFIVTNYIGKKNVWDSGSIALLNESQIDEMQSSGIVFGSHTANHVDLSKAGANTIKQELEISRKKIEELTSRLDIPFCYPYSRFSEESKNLVKESGYVCAFGGDGGSLVQSEDLFNLMRVQVFPSTSLFGFWKKLQPWYPAWMAWQKRAKN